MTAKVAIVYYSMYGHVKTLAKEIAAGVKSTGAQATLFQVQETLPEPLLKMLKAPPADTSIPIMKAEDLPKFDGILFGVPTRYGMAASQMKAFLDSTGGLWAKGLLVNKTGGVFFSTGTQGGGQETTALTFYTQMVHQGMTIVPLGYTHPKCTSMEEIKGGSPYGPGTLAGADGSRQVSALEKEIAHHYGARFATVTSAFVKGMK